jgi:hypothetical protein
MVWRNFQGRAAAYQRHVCEIGEALAPELVVLLKPGVEGEWRRG